MTPDLIFALVEIAVQVAQEPTPAPTAPSSDAPSSVEGALLRTLVAAGPVGVFFLAVLFKKGVMTTSEHTTASESWDRERTKLMADLDEAKKGLAEAHEVYTQQVIPTLTRVLDAERELVDLRREEQAERRRRAGE